MSGIVRILIESGNNVREIELSRLADQVTVVFDDDREIVVNRSGVIGENVQVVDPTGKGSSLNAADNGSTVQNVSAGGNAYVAARNQTLNVRE